jgi:hypothetical protein
MRYDVYSKEFDSIIRDVQKNKNQFLLKQKYTSTELQSIIQQAMEQNEMAIYLIYELYKSIPL